jgi:hypothetical protein
LWVLFCRFNHKKSQRPACRTLASLPHQEFYLVTVVWLTILMPQIKLLKFNKILDFYAGNDQILCKSRAGLHQSKPITIVALNIIDKNQ